MEGKYNMKILCLPQAFSVCKISDLSQADLSREFVFLARTDAELSLVCETEHVPTKTLAREDGWRAVRIEGVLNFSMVGVLARISSLLAEQGISIFAVSTYNTDYIFTKAKSFDPAIALLREAGYTVT